MLSLESGFLREGSLLESTSDATTEASAEIVSLNLKAGPSNTLTTLIHMQSLGIL